VNPGLSSALVSATVDVYATLAGLVGGSPGDGQLLTATGREYAFVWHGADAGQHYAVISERWKLLRTPAGMEELYDLLLDPFEEDPLEATGLWADKLRAWGEEILPE
jgi:hypothetical protein